MATETFNSKSIVGALTVSTNENGTSGMITTDAITMPSTMAIATQTTITSAIDTVATARANNGAKQSVLGFAGEVLSVNKANLEAASSRITDVDVASESTQLARWNVMVQSGTAMLAQANQSAQSALRLLS